MSEPDDGGRPIDIAVDDLAAMVRVLRGSGVEVSEPTPGVDGGYATLREPDGTEVRLHAAGFGSASVSSTDDNAVRVLPEDVQAGDEPAGGAGKRNISAILLPVVLLVVAVTAFVLIRQPATGGTDANGFESVPSAEPSMANTGDRTATPTTASGPVNVVDRGGPIAGITAPWDLFVLGDNKVVRVELAQGRVTTTEVPGNTRHGSSIVVGPDSVLISAGIRMGNYLIADGRPAERAPGELSDVNRAVPGPKPGQLWGRQPDGAYALYGFDGSELGKLINLPDRMLAYSRVVGDGNGNLVFSNGGGHYVASPDGARRITSGRLWALGPTTALARECDERARCETVVIDRSSGDRREIPVDQLRGYGRGGISPDGATAALRTGAQVKLIDLRSGETEFLNTVPTGGSFSSSSGAQRLAWSPDSRWLFVVFDDQLVAVDVAARKVHDIKLPVDQIDSVAIRAGG